MAMSLVGTSTAVVPVGQAQCLVGPNWWPPRVAVSPAQPEEGDTVTVTVSGIWPDTCAPNASGARLSAGQVGIDVILAFDICDRQCGDALTPWEQSVTIEGLEVGTYALCATLFDPACQAEPCTPCTPMGMLVVYCPGDLNGDNATDLSDLTLLLSNFGMLSGATRSQGDLDGDGDVDLSDLTSLLSNFGRLCG
jgi:hypothetical protein